MTRSSYGVESIGEGSRVASASYPQEPEKVRPLEWRDMTYDDVPEFLAHHSFGSYTIKFEADFSWPWIVRPFCTPQSNYQTLEEAKADCEAHYTRGILSALENGSAGLADAHSNETTTLRSELEKVRGALEEVVSWLCDVREGDDPASVVRCAVASREVAQSALGGAYTEGSRAARDVLAERARQIVVEGYTARHDDGHRDGEIGRAAVAYALRAMKLYQIPIYLAREMNDIIAAIWPWDRSVFKPTGKPNSVRRSLVKAGALILAEIDRMDRSALQTKAEEDRNG